MSSRERVCDLMQRLASSVHAAEQGKGNVHTALLLSVLFTKHNACCACSQQPHTRIPCPSSTRHTSTRRSKLHAADTGQLGAADLPPEEPQEPSYSVQVFPRIKEKDPYR